VPALAPTLPLGREHAYFTLWSLLRDAGQSDALHGKVHEIEASAFEFQVEEPSALTTHYLAIACAIAFGPPFVDRLAGLWTSETRRRSRPLDVWLDRAAVLVVAGYPGLAVNWLLSCPIDYQLRFEWVSVALEAIADESARLCWPPQPMPLHQVDRITHALGIIDAAKCSGNWTAADAVAVSCLRRYIDIRLGRLPLLNVLSEDLAQLATDQTRGRDWHVRVGVTSVGIAAHHKYISAWDAVCKSFDIVGRLSRSDWLLGPFLGPLGELGVASDSSRRGMVIASCDSAWPGRIGSEVLDQVMGRQVLSRKAQSMIAPRFGFT
jgi:hypothetical protein